MKSIISTDRAPAAVGPYSQAVRMGNLVFLSGQIALRPEGGLVEGDAKAQTAQILKNIEGVLAAAGLTFEHVVKTTIFLSSMSLFADVNEVYGTAFPTDRPARSTVAVAGLPLGVDVEIEAIAIDPA